MQERGHGAVVSHGDHHAAAACFGEDVVQRRRDRLGRCGEAAGQRLVQRAVAAGLEGDEAGSEAGGGRGVVDGLGQAVERRVGGPKPRGVKRALRE